MPDRSDNSKPQLASSKTYQKPRLIKGPVLTNVTANKSVSGSIPGDSCWVARAAFGEADVRWMIFQAWLLEDAPHWFRRRYLRHGESIGAWLTDRDGARRIVRSLMMPAVERKSRS